jgi:hypothetical protein
MERDAEPISLAEGAVLAVLGQSAALRSIWASRQMDPAGAGGPAIPVLAAIEIVLQSAEIYTIYIASGHSPYLSSGRE